MPCCAALHPRLQPLCRLGSAVHVLFALPASPHSQLRVAGLHTLPQLATMHSVAMQVVGGAPGAD